LQANSLLSTFLLPHTATPDIHTHSLHDALPISAITSRVQADEPLGREGCHRLQAGRIEDLQSAVMAEHEPRGDGGDLGALGRRLDRKSTRLNSSHVSISYAVFCLKKKIMTMK